MTYHHDVDTDVAAFIEQVRVVNAAWAGMVKHVCFEARLLGDPFGESACPQCVADARTYEARVTAVPLGFPGALYECLTLMQAQIEDHVSTRGLDRFGVDRAKFLAKWLGKNAP